MTERTLSVPAVARMLGLSDQTIYRRLEDGTLRGFQLRAGTKWLVLYSSVEQYLIEIYPHRLHMGHTENCMERISVSVNG